MRLIKLTKNGYIGILLFLLIGLAYFLTAKGHVEVSDTEFSIRTARAIVENGSLSIQASDSEKGYFYETADGKRYSKYGIGLAFLFIPYVIVAKLLSLFTNVSEHLVLGFIIAFYNILFGAGTCVVTFFMTRQFNASKAISASISMILGFATMCWRYSVWDFSEATQMFFLIFTVYLIIKNTHKSIFFSSLTLFCLLMIKVTNIVLIPVFLFYVLLNNSRDSRVFFKKIALLSIFPLFFGILILYLNFIRFGNPLETGYGKEASRFFLSGLGNIGNLLFSMNKGIFIYNPILLLTTFGYIKFVKCYFKEAMLFLCVIFAYLIISSTWHSWGGGWSWGPRLLVPTLPFWLIPLCFLFSRGKKFVIVLCFFIIPSVLIQTASVVIKTQEYHTIRYYMVDENIERKMPPDILGIFVLLKHKIFQNNNLYDLREFGVNTNQQIDTSKFETFRGLNLWYCHLARHYDRPLVKYIPILFLPFLFILFMKLLKACVEKEHEKNAILPG